MLLSDDIVPLAMRRVVTALVRPSVYKCAGKPGAELWKLHISNIKKWQKKQTYTRFSNRAIAWTAEMDLALIAVFEASRGRCFNNEATHNDLLQGVVKMQSTCRSCN